MTPPTTTASTVLLKHHLKSLRLPTVARECEKIAVRCAVENVDHLGYLLRVCELELIERERKAAERRLKAARFPAPKTLAEFDFAARPSVNKPPILDLARGVPASEAGAELLFDVIGTAYERTSVILTTNLAFENWTEVLGNERLTGAALDRLTHRCHIVELTGESYRLQDAKRRRTTT